MFDWGSGKVEYLVAGFPDDSAAIDFILDKDVVKKIYAAWDESKNGALVDFGGGVKAITAKMLVIAGSDFLVGIKNIGQVRATQILSEVTLALSEVPFDSGL